MKRVKRVKRRLAIVLLFLAFLAAVTGAACSKPAPPDENALRAEDKAELGRLVALDVKVSKAMKDADDASHVGDAGAAIASLDGRAVPLADDAIRQVDGWTPKSAWGAEKKSALSSLVHERRSAIGPYRAAVESNDPNKLLEQILVQSELERRAIATVAAIDEQR